MSGRLTRFLLGVPRDEEVRRARVQIAEDRNVLLGDLAAEDRALSDEMRRRERAPHVTLGNCPPGVPFRVRLADLDGTHSWCTAGTGGGKTRFSGSFLTSVLARLLAGEPIAVVVVGLQGDLCELVLRSLGALLQGAPAQRRDRVLSRLTVARFFRGEYLPAWNILARSPHAPLLVQAGTLAEIIENALGAALGSRQETALTMLLALAIEARLPVNVLRLLLHEPEALGTLARSSSEPLVASYIRNRFARESSATMDGIASRLDRLLSLDDGLRGSLVGPETIDFARCFEPGSISVFDFAGTPLGAEGARRALSALTLQSLVTAALSSARRIAGPTLVVIDEAQLAFTPATVRTLETALTTIRQFRVGLHFVNQSLVQIPRDFVQLLATNVSLRFLGRSGELDASLSQEFLRRTGRVPKPRAPFAPQGDRPEFLSRSEETAFRIAECGALPRRTFFVTERGAPFGVRRMEAPAFDPPSWGALPRELREVLERGATGVPRTELIERAKRIEAEALNRFANSPDQGSADDAEHQPRRRARKGTLPRTPDAITRAAGWGERKGGRS